jgi:hypothetical protein
MSALNLYPPSAHNVFHNVGITYPPHVDAAVQDIYKACKGFGTDEAALTAILGSKSPEQRSLIAMRYKELYSKSLKDLMLSETSGHYGRLLRMISTPLPECEAQILRDATKGMGTNENLVTLVRAAYELVSYFLFKLILLSQILSGRTNAEMNILKKAFYNLTGKDLAVTMNSELSGDYKKVIMAVLQVRICSS